MLRGAHPHFKSRPFLVSVPPSSYHLDGSMSRTILLQKKGEYVDVRETYTLGIRGTYTLSLGLGTWLLLLENSTCQRLGQILPVGGFLDGSAIRGTSLKARAVFRERHLAQI